MHVILQIRTLVVKRNRVQVKYNCTIKDYFGLTAPQVFQRWLKCVDIREKILTCDRMLY